MSSETDRKKIMFYDTADRQARLKIRCQYDGFTQSQFFRMMLTGYIENDSRIIQYIDESKEALALQGKAKRNKIARMHKKMKETENKFNLSNSEIENIFYIIEEA